MESFNLNDEKLIKKIKDKIELHKHLADASRKDNVAFSHYHQGKVSAFKSVLMYIEKLQKGESI